MIVENYPYTLFDSPLCDLPSEITFEDHLFGFSQSGHNLILDKLEKYSQDNNRITVTYQQILDNTIQKNYPNLTFKFDLGRAIPIMFEPFADYNQHPEINYKNFICSFNGSSHVSRKLLVAILEKYRWFDSNYCSKNFTYSSFDVDGHVSDYISAEQQPIYTKLFANSEEFNQTISSFGHNQYSHGTNIHTLENKLTESFLHIISETVATSYYPFVTEKFLYSVVTRGLFLAYAQPGWHAHLEKYYGFKPYTKLFDYRFDHIQNPVERLVELMSMISKFSVLSADEWRDLYLLEQDTIEYNYNHYFSQDYLKYLANYS